MDIKERKQQFLQCRANRQPGTPTRFYLDAYLAHLNESPMLREAYAFNAFWSNVELEVYPEELIVGVVKTKEPIRFYYGCGTYVEDTDIATPEELEAVRRNSYKFAPPEVFTEQEIVSINACASTSTGFGGHAALDFERVVGIGLDGYRSDINHFAKEYGTPKQDFYKAMNIVLDGIVALINRLAALTTGDVAASLHHIASKPPETFHQALQLVWILHYLNDFDSFGRFDRYLLPFYLKETDPSRAKVLLVDFWLKIEDVEQIQNMTIGGGEYSELTLLCLDVTRELAFKGPNLCLRVTPNIPANIMNAAMDCLATGIGLPALYNDGVYTQSLTNSGIPADIAENHCFAGCSQVMIPGRSNFANDIGLINVGKILEITLYDGYDPRTNRQVGPQTGKDFSCFDDFYNAFMRQLEYACVLQADIHNKELPYRASCEGYALRTLFTRGCLQSATGMMAGGAEFNNVQLELIGITNAADSLYAVKKAVFEDNFISFAKLAETLRDNWGIAEQSAEGLSLQRYFRALPKFGNDHKDVDSLRTEITEFLYKRLNSEPGPFGGIYVPGEVIFVAHEYCGVVTGATPDGRADGEVLADSAGAGHGCSTQGPTALMNSVLTLPMQEYLLTSVVLNMRFLPGFFNDAVSRQGISLLIQSYFAQGGMQLQINVCDSETLKNAQKNPENYQDLVVRVGGYSDYFVRLSKTLQDEIIGRAAYSH